MDRSQDNRRASVFVASSDNTRDVFDRVFAAFRRWWPECPYNIYAGFNLPYTDAQGFTPVYAPVSGWAGELSLQLQQIKADYVILFLDDFLLLKKVATDRLCWLVDRAVSLDLSYLRLSPVRRAALPRLIHRCSTQQDAFETVPKRDPYYSSLQVALWKRSHLLDCLKGGVGIWDFEHLRPSAVDHHAIVGESPFTYRHVVEKGRWLPDAAKLLNVAKVRNELGVRPQWPRTYGMWRSLGLARFEILGYTGMRLRESLRQASSRAGTGRGT